MPEFPTDDIRSLRSLLEQAMEGNYSTTVSGDINRQFAVNYLYALSSDRYSSNSTFRRLQDLMEQTGNNFISRLRDFGYSAINGLDREGARTEYLSSAESMIEQDPSFGLVSEGDSNVPEDPTIGGFFPDVDGSSGGTTQESTAEGADRVLTRHLPSGTLRRGDRGPEVEKLQRLLVRAGYEITVDGIFGPATEGALKQFQERAGLRSDGIYGPNSRGAMAEGVDTGGAPTGGSPSGGSGPGGGGGSDGGGSPGDGNADIDGAPEVHSIPTDGELWEIDGQYAVAYQSEEGGPWVYYTIPDQDALETFFPSGVPSARDLSQEDVDRLGAISPGSAFLLTNNLGENWEEGFNATIEREARLKPWLQDPEVQAVFLQATLEGRNVTAADLESTEYFAERSDAEIDYVEFMATAGEDEREQYHIQFRDSVRQKLIDSGVRDPNPELVSFIAEKWASAQWSDAYTSRQIVAVSNPYSSVEMDSELQEMTADVEVNSLAAQVEQIRQEAIRWLGPVHGAGYSDEWYRQWAGAIMDDKNAEQDFIDLLKGQRMALYPEYENENLTYEDISAPWQSQMQQQWGITPANSKHWGVLDKVIRANDAEEAGKILRRKGIDFGIEQVQDQALEAFGRHVGDQVVRSF